MILCNGSERKEVGLNMVVFGFESITSAMKARKLLRRAGIASRLVRLDEIDSDFGCTYSLEISEILLLEAVAVLRRASVSYRLRQ